MVNHINDDYIKLLQSKIRDINTPPDELKESLQNLGYVLGIKVCAEKLTLSASISTPMNATYTGLIVDPRYENVIISTKDDYLYFAKGVANAVGNATMGYIDFNHVRGNDIYTSPIRSMELPDILTGKPVGYIIVTKSVIATGCTAISLAKKAYEKYMPKGIIIVSAFFSMRGLDELTNELHNVEIYVGTESDEIDTNGMLVPGVGNLDIRINM